MTSFENHVRSQTEKCFHNRGFHDLDRKVFRLEHDHDTVVNKDIPDLRCRIPTAKTTKQRNHLQTLMDEKMQKAAKLLAQVAAVKQQVVDMKKRDIAGCVLACSRVMESCVSKALVKPPNDLIKFKPELRAKLMAKHQKMLSDAQENLVHWAEGEYLSQFDAAVQVLKLAAQAK